MFNKCFTRTDDENKMTITNEIILWNILSVACKIQLHKPVYNIFSLKCTTEWLCVSDHV